MKRFENFKRRLTGIGLIMTISLLVYSTLSSADQLPLTPVEIQKLKADFPVDSSGEQLIWKGDPLSIELPLNQEKRLVFPSHVTFDAKGALSTDQLRIINNDKSIYLTALKPLTTTRVYVTLLDTHEVVMLDLTTTPAATTSTATIAVLQNNDHNVPTSNGSSAPASVTASPSPMMTSSTVYNPVQAVSTPQNDNDAYVTLTRYVWQQLYAPDRLLANPDGVARAPMETTVFRPDLIYGDKVIAHPLAAWQYAGHTLTAVEVRNKYAHRTVLSPHDLCGTWETATFYPRRTLQPAGSLSGDTTTLLLVSSVPFNKALEDCHASA